MDIKVAMRGHASTIPNTTFVQRVVHVFAISMDWVAYAMPLVESNEGEGATSSFVQLRGMATSQTMLTSS